MSFILVGCGNSEMRAAKREFMSGCQQAVPSNICSCAFDKWSSTYTEDNFIRLSQGQGMQVSSGKTLREQLEEFLGGSYKALEYCASK